MENHPREKLIADFKQWLNEHKEQVQEHTLDALPMEDVDDGWEYEIPDRLPIMIDKC